VLKVLENGNLKSHTPGFWALGLEKKGWSGKWLLIEGGGGVGVHGRRPREVHVDRAAGVLWRCPTCGHDAWLVEIISL